MIVIDVSIMQHQLQMHWLDNNRDWTTTIALLMMITMDSARSCYSHLFVNKKPPTTTAEQP